MKIRNINPLGAVDFPLLGRVLEAGEVFELQGQPALDLLKQEGNWERVPEPKPRKAPTPRKKAAKALAAPKTPQPASGHESVPAGTPDLNQEK